MRGGALVDAAGGGLRGNVEAFLLPARPCGRPPRPRGGGPLGGGGLRAAGGGPRDREVDGVRLRGGEFGNAPLPVSETGPCACGGGRPDGRRGGGPLLNISRERVSSATGEFTRPRVRCPPRAEVCENEKRVSCLRGERVCAGNEPRLCRGDGGTEGPRVCCAPLGVDPPDALIDVEARGVVGKRGGALPGRTRGIVLGGRGGGRATPKAACVVFGEAARGGRRGTVRGPVGRGPRGDTGRGDEERPSSRKVLCKIQGHVD